MLNKSTSRSKYVVQSGVTQYPVGFEFFFNGDDTPQIRVIIGAMVAEENLHFVISEDLLTINLIPLEEEAPVDPNDYSWMDKWVGMDLVIERDIPFVQESDYQLGRISPERIEKDFDASVMRDQQLSVEFGDAVDKMEDISQGVEERLVEVEAKAEEALQGSWEARDVAEEAHIRATDALPAAQQAEANSIAALEKAATAESVANSVRDIADQANTNAQNAYANASAASVQASNAKVKADQALAEAQMARQIADSKASESELENVKTTIEGKAEKDSVYTKEQVDAKVSSVYKVKGSVANYESLPADAVVGDVYNVLNTGINYVWTTDGWDALGGVADLTDYAKKEDLSGYLPSSGGDVTGHITLSGGWASTRALRFDPLGSGDVSDMVLLGCSQLHTLTLDLYGNKGLVLFGAYGGLSATNLTLGDSVYPWKLAYIEKLNNGADLIVPTEGGTLARLEDLEGIGGGASLPDQTGNAGKFLMTDGTEASWGGDKLVQNNANFPGSGLAVGTRSVAKVSSSTAYGTDSKAEGQSAVAFGPSAQATSLQSVAVGSGAKSTAVRAIQLGSGTNSDADTFKVANTNGNFELMDTNGNVPLERLTYVTNQIGDISTALSAIIGE